MPYLVDTNVLLRSNDPNHVQHSLAASAVAALRARNEQLCVARQNLIEFRNVATRPLQNNGLGLSAADADNELTLLEQDFAFLPDVDGIYLRWRLLVAGLGVMGKQVHDTRLVAVMLTYGVTHLLTFNGPDFARFQVLPAALGAGIQVVHPQSV